MDPIFASVPVAEQGLNAALAVLRLSRKFSPERLEAACRVALQSQVRSPRYAHLRPILDTGQDRASIRNDSLPEPEPGGYVRGSDYYSGGAR